MRDRLPEILSTLLMLPPGELKPETSLASLDTSLGSVRLVLALKRLGLTLPGNRVPPTFRDLERALDANPASPAISEANPAPAVTAPGSFQAGLQVGLDIQEISGLPVPADYWEDDFYRGNFDKSEIAYAVVATEPRTHLAGFWCAKEALRKCDQSFAGTNPALTAVTHDEAGRPYLVSVTPAGRIRLPHALSISHSGPVASAVVVIGPASPPPPSPAVFAPREPEEPAPRPRSSPSARLILAAGILVALAAVAIVVIFRSWS